MRIGLFCLLMTAFAGSFAQEFTDRTNIISVDFSKPVDFNTLAAINWVTPKVEQTGSLDHHAVIEALIDSHHVLTDIIVSVRNGGREENKIVPVEPNTFTKKISIAVVLYDGKNVITISVINNKNGKISSTRYIEVAADALMRNMNANRKDYALIFASDRYDYWSSLSSPINDAQALEEILKETYGFETDLVRNPSMGEIGRKLEEYAAKKYSAQDQVFVYFSGHCYFDQSTGRGYLIAANSPRGEPQSYFPQTELRSMLDKFPCDRIFLVVDACCGDLTDTKPDHKVTPAILTREELVANLGLRTRKFLTVGTTEFKNERVPGNHSPFTAKLLEALKQRVFQGQVITLDQITSYYKSMEVYFGDFGKQKSDGEFVFIPK